MDDPRTRSREVRGLLVPTSDREESRDETWFGRRGRVCYRPLRRWLLEDPVG